MRKNEPSTNKEIYTIQRYTVRAVIFAIFIFIAPLQLSGDMLRVGIDMYH